MDNSRYGEETEWDDSLPGRIALSNTPINAQYRFIGVDQNLLEFWIKVNSTFKVESFDSIQSTVRLDWTLDEFYADGGASTMVSRIAASLGIHESRIKVVSIRTGSLIVEYAIIIEEGGTTEELQ